MMNNVQRRSIIAMAVFVVIAAIGWISYPSFAGDASKPATESAAKGKAGDAKAKSPEIVESGWSKRCSTDQKSGKKQCEIFQRLGVKDASTRVAEFAVGFPPAAEGQEKGAARGVVVLPLGILLDDGIGMKIDDSKPYNFKIHFCNNSGCYGYIDMKKDFLDSMKKAKAVYFFCKSTDGQNVNLVLSTAGFEKVLSEIE